jgi:hypothetical protein
MKAITFCEEQLMVGYVAQTYNHIPIMKITRVEWTMSLFLCCQTPLGVMSLS